MKRIKFKMPVKANLSGRSSTISNAFAISVTPYIPPTEDQVEALYQSLEIKDGICAYCLGEGTGKDHIKPLVRDGLPTGYITDIHNLVPCCQACNSSKGSKSFATWYKSPENSVRLHQRGLSDSQIDHRFSLLLAYEEKIGEPLNYSAIVGEELWQEFNARRKRLIQQLAEDQKFCDELNSIIMQHIANRSTKN